MTTQGQFILMTPDEFRDWLSGITVKRQIALIQLHHTWLPDYNNFHNNAFKLLEGMKNFHVQQRHFSDIAQNLTTFPDGTVAICRPLGIAPAGIKGANANGICIENLGNFDMNGDLMTPDHRRCILSVVKTLLDHFNLQASTDSVVYHHWFSLSTGKRTDGTGDVKTCPGTNWFGGNTVSDCENNLIPLLK
jgi:hypothetical protein